MGHLTRARLPSAFMAPKTIRQEYPPYFIVWQTKLVCNLGPLSSSYHPATSRHHLHPAFVAKITLLQCTGSNVKYSLHHFFRFAILHLLKNDVFTSILEGNHPARNTVHNETFLGILQRKCTAFAD